MNTPLFLKATSIVVPSDPAAALAIFVKTPGLSRIKTRLAAGVGDELAAEFYRLAVEAILAVAQADCV